MSVYNEGSRRLQDRFDTRRLADRIDERIVHDDDRRGRPRVHRGLRHVLHRDRRRRGPAAVLVQGRRAGLRARPRRADDRLPDLRRQRHVPDRRERPRQPAGRPALHRLRAAAADAAERRRLGADDDPLLAEYPEAQLVVRVEATEVFPNCPRYIHEYRLVERSRFVPREECRTPVPAWKTREWAATSCAATIRRTIRASESWSRSELVEVAAIRASRRRPLLVPV